MNAPKKAPMTIQNAILTQNSTINGVYSRISLYTGFHIATPIDLFSSPQTKAFSIYFVP
jgi:hypothetical protein